MQSLTFFTWKLVIKIYVMATYYENLINYYKVMQYSTNGFYVFVRYLIIYSTLGLVL